MADKSRGKGRPKLTEAAGIDRAIRDAALAVMAEHGEAATMQAVATKAGLSRKSLYARYPNKEELFLNAIRDLLKSVDGLKFDMTGSAEDRLLHYIQAALELLARPDSQAFQRLLTINPIYIAALRTEMLDASRKMFHEPLVRLLEDAKTDGEFAVTDVDATARIVIRLIFTERLSLSQEREFAIPPSASQDAGTFMARLLTQGLTPRQR
jgi:AcrR family transcriptional regulator